MKLVNVGNFYKAHENLFLRLIKVMVPIWHYTYTIVTNCHLFSLVLPLLVDLKGQMLDTVTGGSCGILDARFVHCQEYYAKYSDI